MLMMEKTSLRERFGGAETVGFVTDGRGRVSGSIVVAIVVVLD